MKEVLKKSLDTDQLRQTIRIILREERKSSEEDLLTRKQAADFLGVSLPTLHSWINKKWLPSYLLGGKRYFKKNEVLDALVKSSKISRS